MGSVCVGYWGLKQILKYGGFRASMDFCHLYRMGFASLAERRPTHPRKVHAPRGEVLGEERWSSRQRPYRDEVRLSFFGTPGGTS
jgi:hypothetical protein